MPEMKPSKCSRHRLFLICLRSDNSVRRDTAAVPETVCGERARRFRLVAHARRPRHEDCKVVTARSQGRPASGLAEHRPSRLSLHKPVAALSPGVAQRRRNLIARIRRHHSPPLPGFRIRAARRLLCCCCCCSPCSDEISDAFAPRREGTAALHTYEAGWASDKRKPPVVSKQDNVLATERVPSIDHFASTRAYTSAWWL
ncbi:hypothetical protein HPB47_019652 [Ixodes persulcatus]|uniref:Uncharacterized protein n=1 Tax=Ixodes persulcatus TaxID=34615 RepID=A0AC60QJN0_IXOPE|nr:hypothetical protein HPB47_019652 [Ixodes persulcatus]